MKLSWYAGSPVAALLLGCQSAGERALPLTSNSLEMSTMQSATGSFTVSMKPDAEAQDIGQLSLGRFTNEKVFAGDLEGSSRGTMLTVMTGTEGSAGYVLIERFEGALRGKRGSFALQHSSTVSREAQNQSITVVPDSGSGELTGLTGSMTVAIRPDGHHYTLAYSLPENIQQ